MEQALEKGKAFEITCVTWGSPKMKEWTNGGKTLEVNITIDFVLFEQLA